MDALVCTAERATRRTHSGTGGVGGNGGVALESTFDIGVVTSGHAHACEPVLLLQKLRTSRL